MAPVRTAFQRRHYQAVADVLATANVTAQSNLFATGLIHELRDRFADMFQADNPRFVRSRFEDACTRVP